MNARELQDALDKVLGECTDDTWSEWWDEYTGANALYHVLNDTGHDARYGKKDNELLTKNGDTVTVKGLGDFTKMEMFTENWDAYEQMCDTVLVFEFNGSYFRVDGRLDSHQGGVYGDLQEVVPAEKTIQVWERV